MRVIEVDKWSRKLAYENFIQYTNPVFSVSTRMDVTELVSFCKRNGKSFFASFLYIFTQCANQVEEMRIRIQDEKVVVYDIAHPSYVVLREDEEIVSQKTQAIEDYDEFCAAVKRDVAQARVASREAFNSKSGPDCYYVSCLPWVDIHSVSNPYNFADKAATSIPRITWGKYVQCANGRYEIGMDIAAHHALIDGRQVAKVFEKMTYALNHIDEVLCGGDEK